MEEATVTVTATLRQERLAWLVSRPLGTLISQITKWDLREEK